jgi:outer membrane protein W
MLYYGVVDVGFRGRFLKTNRLNIGLHLNGSFFRHTENIKGSSYKNLYIIQPKVYAEFDNSQKFKPLLGIGYSLMTYKKSGSVDDGVNLSLGFSYNLTETLFLQIQYDSIFWTEEFTRRGRNFLPVVDDSDNQIAKLGIGYRF